LTRIVLQGKGPNFCSGGDLAEFGTVSDTATAHSIRMQRSAGWWIHQLANKTAVRVHGACVGAGVELPAFAGTVTATPDATFTLPEVTMGLIPGAGGTASIPRRIGRQRTGWLALSGRTIDAQVACSWGLVDEVSASER
jgi:enoyl-CoA hydratase/carnithine racemase